MANKKQSATRRLTMAKRAEQLAGVVFPEVPEEWLWHRSRNDGFITIPRTMPIVMEAIDSQSKGQPAGHTLFALWCRSPDHACLSIENPMTFASEAGFKGERAVDTWRRRMRKLRELGFIQTAKGSSGEFHYVLLMNPNMVMERLHHQKMIQAGIYAKFHERVLEIGAYSEIELAQEQISLEEHRAKQSARRRKAEKTADAEVK